MAGTLGTRTRAMTVAPTLTRAAVVTAEAMVTVKMTGAAVVGEMETGAAARRTKQDEEEAVVVTALAPWWLQCCQPETVGPSSLTQAEPPTVWRRKSCV